MAEPLPDVAPTSAQAAAAESESKGDAGVTAQPSPGTPSSRPSMERATSSFQAVNDTSTGENSNVAKAATSGKAQPAGELTPPPGDAAVAQNSAQTTKAPSNRPHASAPSSSNDGTDVTMTEQSSYGTRSRGGRNRPNYAEDQQDFEIGDSVATTTSYKKKQLAEPPAGGQNASEAKRTQDFAKFVAVNSAPPNAKESVPGAAANSSSSNPKKRKSAGASSSLTQPLSSSTTASASPAPSGATRKVGAASSASTMARETNVLSFRNHKSRLNKHGELVADDGTKLAVNDHVYLVCEPPGDPYYLCRIMEFLHTDSDNPASPVDSIRVNWYYRPRDVQRFNNDNRLVYATMHSDMCPITSLRGKCTIKHRSEIDDLEEYRKQKDCFYFVQVFDRFIRRWYECIPTSQIINVPEKVKKALDERWKFVAVETGRVKELTSAVKTCKRCTRYCASSDSVDCAICKNSYHMNCVQPPLPKKPSRGFAWACGPCSRASERKMEARNTPTMSAANTDVEDEEVVEEEAPAEVSNDTTRAPSPSGSDIVMDDHPATQAEIRLAQMWPMRYLGIHCRVEDALQYDDRAIYPRASSRLGPRHQANTLVWHGQPVELVKPPEIKKKIPKNTANKKDTKQAKEAVAALEADRAEKAKRPKWVQDEPPGYVARGEDYPNDDPRNTARRMFLMPQKDSKAVQAASTSPQVFVDDYVKRAKGLARMVGVPPFGINFIDKALELLTNCDYDVDVALKKLSKMDRRVDLHEPVLSKDQLSKFEDGVAKYGSEHRLIRLHMKTNLPNSDIVRFYYLWKKTPKGREIWGSYGGRKGTKKKLENDAAARVHSEVAHDVDDSAFDNEKAARHKRGFQCKFCSTRHSRQWRRAPGVSAGQTVLIDSKTGNKEKKDRVLLALCLRCAGLWRKYAIQWESIEEVTKKIAQGGGKAWKRKIDAALLQELMAAEDSSNEEMIEPASALPSIEAPGEPPKKKSKADAAPAVPQPEPVKKKEKPPPPPKVPTPPPPPIVPSQPEMRELPCSVCRTPGDTIECGHCKLTVHRRCFGLEEDEGIKANGEINWVCEQCQNDRNPQVSTEYACALCLTEETLLDLVEPPKVTHKKKTDREREKEKLEKDLADGMRAEYRGKQLALNRPFYPREPLKQTAGNNWVHVYCAVWTPEVRFSNAKKLEVAEGIQLIPPARHEAICKLCKNRDHQNKPRSDKGACVSCLQCGANFHVSCGFEAGYQFGFDVTPVKGSRKDSITTITLGEESGAVIAAIWCKEHAVKTIIHPMTEVVDESGKTALQHFVENYKQADLTWTGTARKANLAQSTKEKGLQNSGAAATGNRRESAANSIAAAVKRGARVSSATDGKIEDVDGATELSEAESQTERHCMKCNIDVTPRWHLMEKSLDKPAETSNDQRRMSITLGELTDMRRSRSTDIQRQNGAVEGSSGPQQGGRPLASEQANPGNIRFMAPGATGRAWDSMPGMPVRDFSGNPLTVNGQPHNNAAAETNGEPRPSIEDPSAMETDEGYHTHALPRFQNPATVPSPKAADPEHQTDGVQDTSREWLCHKCFIKKKLDPTPPPPDPPARMEHSPPKQLPLQLQWGSNGGPTGPHQPPHPGFERSSQPPQWDEQRQSHQPPPMNGYGQPPVPMQRPPHPGYSYLPPQPYGPHPNGYHGPPPSHNMSGPGGSYQPHHERHASYQYPGHSSPNPPPHAPHNGPPHQISAPPPPAYNRPSAPPGMPSGPPLSNGITSPHAAPQYPPLQSPTHPTAPHQYAPFPGPPRRTESPFSTQLPPLGGPLHAGSPSVSIARPDPQATQPTTQQLNGAHGTPQTAPPRPGSQAGGSGTSHAETQSNGTPVPVPMPSGLNTSGASASPNLRNLLH